MACGFEPHPGHLSVSEPDLASPGERVTISDGTSILVRPIQPADKKAIEIGFEQLSEESRYRRFFAPLVRLSARDLAYLTEVDHHDHEALIAHSEEGEPLGVARYIRGDDPEKAEVAVVVVDDWQRRGVATALLTRLTDRARAEGIHTFTATVLAENRHALGLMSSMGESHRVGGEHSTVEMEIELPQAGLGRRLREALRHAASGMLAGRDPAHPRIRLHRR
jgi:GNAT superfamily N-acetyltransferase